MSAILTNEESNNLYVTGYQQDGNGICVVDSSEHIVTINYGYYGNFLCKFDKSGKFIWSIANKFNSVLANKSSVACDLNGDIIITGIHVYDVDIYELTDINTNTSAFYKTLPVRSGNCGLYMVKYNSSGKAIWTNGLYMDTSAPIDQVLKPVSVIDGNGNFYLAAEIIGEYVHIYDTRNENTARQIVEIPNASVSNTILVKYNNNGILQWYTFISGVSGQPSICVDNRFIKGIDTNNVYLSGTYYNSTIDIYNGTSSGGPAYETYLNSINSNDIFIVN